MNATMTQPTPSGPKVLTPEERAARPWLRYRLRPGVGRHEQLDEDGKSRSYPQGAVCASQEDLAERWPEKFEIVRDSAPSRPEDVLVPAGYKLVKVGEPAAEGKPASAKPAPQPLHTKESLAPLSVEDLKRIAADEEIDLKGMGNDKERIARAILGVK